MDKKNTTIGILLLVIAFGMMMYFQPEQPPQAPPGDTPAREQADAPSPTPQDATPAPTGERPAATAPTPVREDAPSDRLSLHGETTDAQGQTWTIANDFLSVTFTDIGAAIESVALIEQEGDQLKYPATLERKEPYTVNRRGDLPMLALSLADHLEPAEPQPLAQTARARYELVEQSATHIVFRHVSPQGVEIRRTYRLNEQTEGPLPYEIDTKIEVTNTGSTALPGPIFFLNLGTFPPTEGDIYGQYLNFGYFDGADTDFFQISEFQQSSGFLGIGGGPGVDRILEEVEGGIVWGALKNQFFASILTTPEHEGRGFFVRDVLLGKEIEDPTMRQGLTADIEYRFQRLDPGVTRLFEGQLYVGPKEYARLDQMGYEQDRVMQFGWLSGISKLLLVSLIGLHSFLGNWGLAIVFLTLIIKTLLWPLTQKQVKSAKRMAKFSKPLQELREKYKDEPQKLNEEMMKFWREHKINPMAGCLPILLQMPIFIGLFFMLRTASELRFASFLWIEDLSRSDTISWLPDLPEGIPVFGGPIHLLPILMGVIMFFQMRMTPTPTSDNMQRKIFQFMPVIFLVFCYNFPSGLVLYWTVQNLFTIGQQAITNRMKDPEGEDELTLEVLEKRAEERRKSGKDTPRKKSFLERVEEKKKEQQQKLDRGPRHQKPKRRKK